MLTCEYLQASHSLLKDQTALDTNMSSAGFPCGRTLSSLLRPTRSTVFTPCLQKAPNLNFLLNFSEQRLSFEQVFNPFEVLAFLET